MKHDFGHKLQQAFTLIEELSKKPLTFQQVARVINCSERTAIRWVYLMDDIGFFVRRIPYKGRTMKYQIDTERTPKFVLNFIK